MSTYVERIPERFGDATIDHILLSKTMAACIQRAGQAGTACFFQSPLRRSSHLLERIGRGVEASSPRRDSG